MAPDVVMSWVIHAFGWFGVDIPRPRRANGRWLGIDHDHIIRCKKDIIGLGVASALLQHGQPARLQPRPRAHHQICLAHLCDQGWASFNVVRVLSGVCCHMDFGLGQQHAA
jgi:hypothetical protein